jgi:hypothetical protein
MTRHDLSPPSVCCVQLCDRMVNAKVNPGYRRQGVSFVRLRRRRIVDHVHNQRRRRRRQVLQISHRSFCPRRVVCDERDERAGSASRIAYRVVATLQTHDVLGCGCHEADHAARARRLRRKLLRCRAIGRVAPTRVAVPPGVDPPGGLGQPAASPTDSWLSFGSSSTRWVAGKQIASSRRGRANAASPGHRRAVRDVPATRSRLTTPCRDHR